VYWPQAVNWTVTFVVTPAFVTTAASGAGVERGFDGAAGVIVQLRVRGHRERVAEEPGRPRRRPAMFQFPLGSGEPAWIVPAWSAVKVEDHVRT